MKKILITGGTGFIGKNLVPRLIAAKYNITLITRNKNPLADEGVKFLHGDLLNISPLENKITDFDVVIHLAGLININSSTETPKTTIESNVEMLINILEVFRKKKTKPLFIFTSTDRVYGKAKKSVVDETEKPYPLEPYTASKILGEVILEAYHHLYGIPYIIFRIDSVYGPYQENMFISDIIKKMINHDKITVGSMKVKKNLIFVNDLTDGFLAAIESTDRAKNKIYNIGGKLISFREVFNIIRRSVEKKLSKKIKIITNHALTRNKKTEIHPFTLSTKLINKNLGWKIKTPLKQGVEETIDYFLNEYEK